MDDAQFAKFQDTIRDINAALDILIADRRELVTALRDVLDCHPTQFGWTPPALERAAKVLARIEGR